MFYRAAHSLIAGLIQYRWMRFFVAAFPLVIGILIVISAFGESEIKALHGAHVDQLFVGTNSSTGEYDYDRITLVGSKVSYFYQRTDFSPALTEDAVVNSASADIWYNDTVIFAKPHVYAIQLYSTSGTSTKYVSSPYLHPDDARNKDLAGAAIPLGIGLAFVFWGLLVPPVWGRKPATSG